FAAEVLHAGFPAGAALHQREAERVAVLFAVRHAAEGQTAVGVGAGLIQLEAVAGGVAEGVGGAVGVAEARQPGGVKRADRRIAARGFWVGAGEGRFSRVRVGAA